MAQRDSNYYEAHGPNRGVPERGANTYEIQNAENEYRRGKGLGREFAYEGLDQSQRDNFAQGVVSAHPGTEHYPVRDYGDNNVTRRPNEFYEVRSPAPHFAERGGQQYTVTIAGEAVGRTGLGAHNSEPTWDALDDAELGGFYYGQDSSEANPGEAERPGTTVQAKFAEKPRTRRNAARVWKP